AVRSALRSTACAPLRASGRKSRVTGVPNTLPQSGRMTLGVAVSPPILEGTTSRAATEISGAEHEGRRVSRHFRKQRAVPRRLCTHPAAPWHRYGRGDEQAASLRTGARASAAAASILLTAPP